MTSDSSGATEPPLARRLARAALGVDPVLLPPEVVAKAKLCLIDFLSCALEAKDLPWSRQAVGIARQLPHAGARIVGTPTHTRRGCRLRQRHAWPRAGAGGHARGQQHASRRGRLPTLLAFTSRAPLDGRSFLAAAVAGYEAGARIGRALITADLARLFRPTGLVGAIAAALAASCRCYGGCSSEVWG
jgi:2-methylcitrate dehydratase PrpD